MGDEPSLVGKGGDPMWTISRGDLENILTMEDVIETLERAFVAHARGRWVIPSRTQWSFPAGIMLSMPALLNPGEGGDGILGAKLVSVFPGNPDKGLPLIYGLYLLYDSGTGSPLALIDGVYLTGVRTGAASAVATKYLSRKDTRSLGIIGTGVQAGFHLVAISAVRKIEVCYLFNRTEAKARKFAEKYSEKLGVNFEVLSSADDVVGRSDVVITSTTSSTPVFSSSSLRKGTHLNVIGAFTPETREVDSQTIRMASLFVDSYQGALSEAGDLLIPIREGGISRKHIRAELSQIVSGTVPGRVSEEEITLFKSVGFAIEDAAVARLAFDRALEKGVGTRIVM